ncbi:MAG: hypothetical protein ACM37W_02685 [Actinomycetota bacterium]
MFTVVERDRTRQQSLSYASKNSAYNTVFISTFNRFLEGQEGFYA